MANPRTPIRDLKLAASPNLKRALSYDAPKSLAKREDLERLYGELLERRSELLADVRKNGVVINQECSNSRAMIYIKKITNPAFTALRATELQLVALAKLIGNGDSSAPAKSALDAELESIRAEMN
jgi:hypothetical protein